MKPLLHLQQPFTLPVCVQNDLVWHCFGMFEKLLPERPSWSGFMQHVSRGDYPGRLESSFLPIIDLKSTDESCIYSTLLFICQQARKLNIVTPCVTFDQPLWLKAAQITQSLNLDIVCHLGGFHMLMSFLGSIGSSMGGSGLHELLETCYGSNTVDHMMSGKAVSRALRGHFIAEAALMTIICDSLSPDKNITQNNENAFDNSTDEIEGDITEQEKEQSKSPYVLQESVIIELQRIMRDLLSDSTGISKISESAAFQTISDAISSHKKYLETASRTAKLWLQYMNYIEVVKLFIRAERTGNWNLHLVATEKMLCLFAATGHNNYAKSARLYLQMMVDLPCSHPWLYEQFQYKGYHTIRRSDRFWAGIWTDLAIEQIMMRTIKSRGGLTRGRGFTEFVRILWVYSMHKCASIHSAMSDLTRLKQTTSEQHIDMGAARIKRDYKDLSAMVSWLRAHDPFDVNDNTLRSISSGLTATEDDCLNIDDAENVGLKIQTKMNNSMFVDISLKKKDQVKNLAKLVNGIKLDDEVVHVNPNFLFSRLIVQVERSERMKSYFEYELTQIPTALLKDSKMRKSNTPFFLL